MSSQWAFLVNLVATWYLVGLIWMVQIVHYNLFDRVGTDGFVRYENDHASLITPIVGPPMLIELATAFFLVVACPTGVSRNAMIVGLAAVIGIWLSTALIQVPCHARLSKGFSESDYRLLVSSNWIRTVLWTLRGGIMLYYAGTLIRPDASSIQP
ncbi:MAG: hypothetical protein AAFV88_06095 [Planctomycetota bacterium]